MEPFSLQNQDWQRLIYLGLILVALLATVAMRRDVKFGNIIKMIATWVVMIIGCIVVYSYRFEFGAIKERVVGEVNPSDARLALPARVVIDAAKDGKFYVDAMIDGSKITFIVDESVSGIVLNKIDAEKIVINPAKLVVDATYRDHGQEFKGASIQINEMVVDDNKIESLDAVVDIDGGDKPSRLGVSFFKRFKSYRIGDKKIILDGLLEAPGKITIRTSADGQFYMGVLINGVKIRCMIDTGASTISLDKTHMKALGINPESLSYTHVVQTANGSMGAASFVIEEVAIGGIKIRNVPAIFSQGDMGGVCLLGMDFLRRFKRYESFQDHLVLTI